MAASQSPPVSSIRIPVMNGFPTPTSRWEGILHAQESRVRRFGFMVGGGLEAGNRLDEL